MQLKWLFIMLLTAFMFAAKAARAESHTGLEANHLTGETVIVHSGPPLIP